jgi:hypothetical protein
MPVVSECDDSWLSDVLSFPLSDEDVWRRCPMPSPGPWPRVRRRRYRHGVLRLRWDRHRVAATAADAGGFTVGVLVLTNYGDREFLGRRRPRR